jgi:hypothetical protein
MDQLLLLLNQIGLGLATNGIYDYLKGCFNQPINAQALEKEIQNRLDIVGVQMTAKGVINALAEKGVLVIDGSHLHANDSLIFGSVEGSASVQNGSKLTTNSSAIHIGQGAAISTNENAQIRQNADGSISFHVGEK